MSVRLKLALTIFATGLLTALLVIATVVYSFQRFENETAYRRGMGFLSRVVSMYDNIFDMHERDAVAFQAWLRALVLFEPDTELYLLDAVWGYSHDGYEHTVTTHINRLRNKLEVDPMRPELILTVRGAGYKMRDSP